MATQADIAFYRALQEARRNIEESQQDIAQQNQRASTGSGLGGTGGTLIGALIGSLLGPGGTAIGAGIGSRLGSEAGEQMAGGYAGGEIPEQLFFTNDTARQNQLLDMARQDMNTQQWTDAILRGLSTWAAGGFGGFGGETPQLTPEAERLIDTWSENPVYEELGLTRLGLSSPIGREAYGQPW